MIDTFQEYVEWTDATAIYPAATEDNPHGPLMYVTLGLVNEMGEYLGAVKRGTEEDQAAELGDVYWYVARVLRETGFDVTDIEDNEGFYQIDPMEAACEVAGHVKKIYRDGITGRRLAHLQQAIGELVQSIRFKGGGLKRSEILNMNVRKLEDRKARSVLGGDGDHR